MPKSVEDRGHIAEATKPLKPRVYRSDRRPDPVQCSGCLIVVCNAEDMSSLYLEASDGSRWRRLSFADEAAQVIMPPAPASIDVEGLKRAVIERAMAELPQPQMQVIAPPVDGDGEAARVIAQGMLEVADHVARLASQNADLMATVDHLRDEVERIKRVRVVTEVDAA